MIVLLLTLWLALAAAVAWIAGGRAARAIGLGALVIGLAAAAVAFVAAPPGEGWRSADLPWIPALGARAAIEVDGLGAVLILLALAVGALAALIARGSIRTREGFFYFNLLLSIAGAVGVFGARDLAFFYVFWEVMLVPMVILIAVWGHEYRVRAAVKFFVFTQAGSLFMLAAIAALGAHHRAETGEWSFHLAEVATTAPGGYPGLFIMLGLFVGFAVKIPAFPFHTWLPDAHTQAPTAGSVVLAGLLLKGGVYGLIRFALPLFPEASLALAPIAMVLGVAGILYGAVVAFAQTDLKRLVAYTSVSHMGFALVGVYAMSELAMQGAALLLVAHAFATGGLFIVAGALDDRLGTRSLSRMGGLWAEAPRLGAAALILAAATLGLPGLANFAAEFSILFGAFGPAPAYAVAAAAGLVLSAVYALSALGRAFFGPPSRRGLRDVDPREAAALGVCAAALLALGLYPIPIMDAAAPAVSAALEPIFGAPGAAP